LKCSRVGVLGKGGFTLIEIIVALCIVAILTAIAVPGFRKVTEDYRLNSTVEDTLDILKACRNYYLIFNEFPPDAGSNTVPNRLDLFIPTRLMNSSKKSFICRPLGKTAYSYDLDNFMNNDDPNTKLRSAGVSLRNIGLGTADWNKCYNKFKSSLGEKYITVSISNRMFCFLPECPGSMDLNSSMLWENRYY
jgi:prepilin-type N-terminal cleavage/methylation domain-containing protein